MAPKEIPRGPLLTTFKNLVNKIIRVYLSVQPKDTVSKKKEFKYITELVFFIQSQDVNIVNRCLKHMEQVMKTNDKYWVAFCWAYSVIINQGSKKSTPFLKQLYKFCVEHQAESLLDLHKIMVMMDCTKRFGPLDQEQLMIPVDIGSSREVRYCTMEQIITTRAQLFSAEIKTLHDIAPAAFGNKPVDYYENIQDIDIRKKFDFREFHKLKNKLRTYIQSGGSLMMVPSLIREMVDISHDNALKANWTIITILNHLNQEYRTQPYSVVEALSFLWVYVGILLRRKKVTGDNLVLTAGENKMFANLFEAAVRTDIDKNMNHILNLWSVICTLHNPSSSSTSGEQGPFYRTHILIRTCSSKSSFMIQMYSS